MITLQRELSKQNKKSNFGISLLVISFIFAAPVMNAVLVVLGIVNQSGQLAFVYIVCTCGLLFYTFLHEIHFMKKCTLVFTFVPIILFVGFLLTQLSYKKNNVYFDSERLSVLAIWPATILIGMILQYEDYDEIDERAIAIVSVLLTFLSFYGVFFSNNKTSGGLQRDDSGLLYQNISYYAAYAIGMTGFLIEEKKLKDGAYSTVLIFMVVLQFALCFISGGKGGALLAIIFIFYFLYHKYKYKIVFFALPMACIYILTPDFINFIEMRFNLNMIGINRILSLIYGSTVTDTGRALLWKNAREMFKSSPILGHGLGSTFYEMNSYSHHVFTDLLAETGITGTLVFIGGLLFFGVRVWKNYKTNGLCRWLLIVFIAGFTMNIVSGYIWANQMVWIPMVVMAGMNPVKKNDRKSKLQTYSLGEI